MTDLLYKYYLECSCVCTDTRTIIQGSLFFALKGPNFNANAFAEEALAKGARYVVIDDDTYKKDERFVLVEDCLSALQQLARQHRDRLTIPVIGLTGSNGKTTSKELINAVLCKKFKTFATKGNLNNHIGVPLTILSIDASIDIAIVEMGANHVGEIESLCKIANPTHGFITNIGKAHIGTFGGFENIIKGKTELYAHLSKAGGTVFINNQNPILIEQAKKFDFVETHFYPEKCELISADPFVKIKAKNGQEITTQLTGAYNFENIAIALTLGSYFGVDEKLANKAAASYAPSNMRSQIFRKATNTIILDAYNANPTSMEAAIHNLSQMNTVRKIAILGDMYELGDEAEVEHKRIGQLLREKKITEAYVVGELMKAAKVENEQLNYFSTKLELEVELKNNPITNATILIKASRGIGLETVIENL